MDLFKVIEDLVFEKSLEKDKIVTILLDSLNNFYKEKHPEKNIVVDFDQEKSQLFAFEEKTVVEKPVLDNQISLKKAKSFDPNTEVGLVVQVPFELNTSRIDLAKIKDSISQGIKLLNSQRVCQSYGSRIGHMITGTIHKKERSGFSVNLGDTFGFLPNSCMGDDSNFISGNRIRAVIKNVLADPSKEFQIILDRMGAQFVKRILETEIPEIFEGTIEIVNIVRIGGYKTKVLLATKSKNIDPVGSCVGLNGARIKPVIAELGGEKIDLIANTDDDFKLVQNSLKPAKIEKIIFKDDFFDSHHQDSGTPGHQGKTVMVYVSQDQKSYAIGKSGYNVILASRLTGFNIKICDWNGDAKVSEETDFDENPFSQD